jgi:hypothetical protein
MPSFTVAVSRTTTESTDITIEAANEETAEEKVMTLVQDPDKVSQLGSIEWQLEEVEFEFLECNEAEA